MHVAFDSADLKPIIRAALAELLEQFGEPGRLAWSEAEAAGLLGVRSHVLRDARLRGEIAGSKLGRGYSYTRAELLAFLERRKGNS